MDGDPPYSHRQALLSGAPVFRQEEWLRGIETAKRRGVFVAVSLAGSKKSGAPRCDCVLPPSLFAREVTVHCGRSLLRRFQRGGQVLAGEGVSDRLLLTH